MPLNIDKTKVMLIQSSRRKGWVLPKGGWEKDEKTAADAACREAWEEGGIIVQVTKELGNIPDTRPTDAMTKKSPKANYVFFQAYVKEEKTEWPEKHKRERAWMTWAQASTALGNRPELAEALQRSELKR